MKPEFEIKQEIERIKNNLAEAKRAKNNGAENWIRGYWKALSWVLK